MSETTRPAPAALAAAPESLVPALIGLSGRLADLMIQETALLVAGRPAEIAALQRDKADLARRYAECWAQLRAGRSVPRSWPPGLAEPLRRSLAQLAAATTENERSLRLARGAADRLLGIIAEAVRDHRVAASGYTSRSDRPKRLPAALGFACDRSL